ncbi:two component transcriptional regulator, LytTR family [Paludibacter propionicigenes WB4]|uniref:Two component transcriptional regulator, LytTR family n=1 Tax=Paludibacter propionicigenes (strain DSM 17365 / JCM 13257 / WB4) TaxID=694427 RepID=E4T1M0_PALPW|nr:LytTR family DNA-binding domain-containing protein [Paludibacter propionicigenes]ADQ78614.1 two component transcriptional regulator, LytTR family [Paludibacter propionicigenes WB4]
MILSCVIVDDEYLAIKVLEDYVSRTENLQLVRAFKRPEEALVFLQSNPVDLLFLDIQMPELDGFSLLAKLDNPPLVIFTTARPDYAVKAYELNVLDYLVKPISPGRFQLATQKALDFTNYRRLAETHQQPEVDYLMINADHLVNKIMHQDIIYIEGLGEYIKFHTHSKVYITLMSLKSLQDILPNKLFARIHKSFIVNKTFVVSFNHQQVQLSNGKAIPLGRIYKQEFLEEMK